ncbi:uncharacterized protein LOC131950157 [Physella acuta]|uniref:uncharacterized protein LOC131950157 n=1 Tax=Physella acuta TaxID=109671 RepID=UPI0027DC4228|nr:uncharacterized protein LOC131950157 [Physella acuta]
MYPPATCIFNITMNKEQLNVSSTNKHIVGSKNPTYYRTECSVEIKHEQLVPGVLEYHVTTLQKLSSDCYNVTSCYALQKFSFSVPIESMDFNCSAEEPNNCSIKCNTNDFCQDGNMYSCQSVQELCLNRKQANHSQNQNLPCNKMCQSNNNSTSKRNENSIEDELIVIIILGIAFAILVCTLIACWLKKRVRKHKTKVREDARVHSTGLEDRSECVTGCDCVNVDIRFKLFCVIVQFPYCDVMVQFFLVFVTLHKNRCK